MNAKRMAVVKHAFLNLDEQSQKRVSFEKLRSSYKASQHPRVKTREKTAETVMNDFLNCMSTKC
jgi:calcyphosin